VKHLVVEGWRTSSHSYALVNQHQLLHLMGDPRLRLSHVDVPFYRPHWAHLDGGFAESDKAALAGLGAPGEPRADVIYRISWPLRVHRGPADRVFVFGTCELQQFQPNSFCGPNGTSEGIDREAVDIVTPSHWSEAGFVSAGFRPERVHVIPHGVDPARFSPANAAEKARLRALYKVPEDAFVFLNVSALTWNKGIAPLLAAFAEHRRLHEHALLVLKGGDALYGSMVNETLEEAAGINPAVKHPAVIGSLRYVPQNMSQSELAGIYRLSDAYVSPYRAEGFNLPILEALACGIPTLVTGGGATDDFCPDHLCLRIAATPKTVAQGNYLEPDVDSIIAGMRQISGDRALLSRAATEGPVWIAGHYSWQRVTSALGALLAG
jgi:glycosyltransferase involved in cell wall biosynthesis